MLQRIYRTIKESRKFGKDKIEEYLVQAPKQPLAHLVNLSYKKEITEAFQKLKSAPFFPLIFLTT